MKTLKLLSLLTIVLIFSCSKQKDLSFYNTDRTGKERVRMYNTHYSKDSVLLGNYIWMDEYLQGRWLDTCKAQPKEKWNKVCVNDPSLFFWDVHVYVFGEGEFKPVIYKH